MPPCASLASTWYLPNRSRSASTQTRAYHHRRVAQLADLEATVGYRFADRELLAQAVRHASWCNQQTPRPADNERLEFLGDAVIYLVVGHRAVVQFPQYDEGDLSRIRQQIIREDTLADAARDIGL